MPQPLFAVAFPFLAFFGAEKSPQSTVLPAVGAACSDELNGLT